MSASIKEVQDDVIAEFGLFDQWMDKYEYLIDLGKKLPLIDPSLKDDGHLIPGCQSRVWLHAELDGDRIHFTADSDAVITRGIIALLIRVLSGQRPADVASADLYFIERIGLREHLSPTRSNGLVSMLGKMRAVAGEFGRMS